MRKLTFDNSLGVYEPSEAFVLANEPLIITVANLPRVAAVGNYYLVFVNEDGVAREHRLRSSDEIRLEVEYLKAGQLLGKVEHRLRGKVVKTWTIEPLLITQIDSNITLSPVIAALITEIEQLKKSHAEDKKTLQERVELAEIGLETLKHTMLKEIAESCETVLKQAIKAAKDNALVLDEKIRAEAELIRQYIKRKRK